MREDLPIEASVARDSLNHIGRVVMVGSGKGGVGKSVVACGLAVCLCQRGYRTGLLDLDIHGASVPEYLGISPPMRSSTKGLEPKSSEGVKVMSIGLFTGSNPVPMRGSEKQGLITQLFGLTNWGRLDYLVVDLPPSTGDELLSAFGLFGRKSSLILVTTPSPGAIAVVSRLGRLSQTEGIRVAGIALNMAYTKRGKTKEFPFGRSERAVLERKLKSAVLAEIPLEPMVSARGLRYALSRSPDFSRAFASITKRVREQTVKDDHRHRKQVRKQEVALGR